MKKLYLLGLLQSMALDYEVELNYKKQTLKIH